MKINTKSLKAIIKEEVHQALQESNMGAAHVEIQNDVQALIEKHREHGLDLKGLVAIIGDMDMDAAAPAEEDPMAAMERHMTGGLQQDRY